MKYIKRYRFFENKYTDDLSPSELKEEIKWILLELNDNGFITTITNQFIRIEKPNNLFDYKEAEDVVERLKDYLGDRFVDIDLYTTVGDGYFKLKDKNTKKFFLQAFRKKHQHPKISLIKIEYDDTPKHFIDFMTSLQK